MGTNTIMGAQVFDNSRGLNTRIVAVNAAGQTDSGEATLTSDDQVDFFGDNAANDGTADSYMTVEELPA